MERVIQNADSNVLRNFLAIVFESFSRYLEILPSITHMPNFKSIGPFKQKLLGGGEGQTPYQSAKSPACLGLIVEAKPTKS